MVLTLEGQQVHATVRPASPELAAAVAPGAGQALEVQLPHRIMLVRDTGGSSAQLVNAEVDGERVALQVLSRGPRHLRLQHCGAQRLVALDAPLAAELTHYMPAPTPEDFSKVGEGRGGEEGGGEMAGSCRGSSSGECAAFRLFCCPSAQFAASQLAAPCTAPLPAGDPVPYAWHAGAPGGGGGAGGEPWR